MKNRISNFLTHNFSEGSPNLTTVLAFQMDSFLKECSLTFIVAIDYCFLKNLNGPAVLYTLNLLNNYFVVVVSLLYSTTA